LLLALLVGIVPTTVLATESTASVQTGQTTIEGTNSFGSLLSEDIKNQQNEDAENQSGGYNVNGLTIENGIAKIEYSTLEKAVLVVALYSEDGVQLLLSGNTIVDPEGTEAFVELEGEIPDYFMATAYLLDTYDYSPLCTSYDTPMYTKEMQELLASTTDDYDADKILNLDADKTTNFAVYADTTIVLEYIEGVNTVVMADDETATYVIENADDNITKLKAGDILAYAYGENQILIVKISSINVAGTTVTINGADVEMEEVFSHVKLETTGDASDVTVDESTAEDGVIYEGLSSEGPQTYSLRAVEGESGWKHYLNFKLVDKKLKDETENLDVSVSISGSLGISIDVKFSYYVSTDRQFIEFKADAGVKASISISGKIKSKLPLPEFKLTAYGVSIGFEPKLQLEFSGKVEYSFFAGFTIGISYENGKGIHDLSTAPKVESEFKLEGSIFFGIDLTPTIEVLKGAIVEAKLEAPIGFELKAALKGTLIEGSDLDADSIHTCEKCVEMELNFKAEFSAKLKFLKCKWLSLETKAKAVEVKIGDMYWSIDRDQFAWGKCPYISYRVTVYVQNSENQAVANTDVVAGWAEKLTEIPLGKTNGNGVVVCYLQEGTYTFMANVDGENLGKEITVEESCKVNLDKASINNGPIFISGVVNPNSLTDHGAIIATGECGTSGDNVIYTLYSSGLLTICGSGNMAEYSSSQKAPWYQYRTRIQSVRLDGIANIGAYALYNCSYITHVEMPQNLVQIGDYAFYGCSRLSNINIPNGVTKVGRFAFWAAGLETLALPDSVTDIGSGAFQSCQKLTYIYIPESVVNIGTNVFTYASRLISAGPSGSGSNIEFGWVSSIPRRAFHGAEIVTAVLPFGIKCVEDNAFEDCMKLVSVQLPKSITEIGYYAFYDCQSLGAIEIPEGTEAISTSAFYNCKSLKKIVMPESVKSIDMTAFSKCISITSVGPIGSGCDYEFGWTDHIPAFAFRGFSGLKKVIIPESINSFGNAAFALCTNLKNAGPIGSGCDYEFGWTEAIPDRAFDECTGMTAVILPDSITSIGEGAFNYCTSLTDISIPETVRTIGDNAFNNCTALKSVYFNATNMTDLEFDNRVFLMAGSKSGGVTLTIGPNVTRIPAYLCSSGQTASENISLNNVVFENNCVQSIGDYAFRGTGIASFDIPDSVITIGSHAFAECKWLRNVTIGAKVESIGWLAFESCRYLGTITFYGNAPTIRSSIFSNYSAVITIYYPSNNQTWTADVMQNYGGNVTWIPYALGEDGGIIVNIAEEMAAVSFRSVQEDLVTDLEIPSGPDAENFDYGISTLSIWGGEYETEITDTYTLKSASFKGLVPGEEYLLLALVSIEATDILAPDNLLYISQGVAEVDGTLVFTYAQREISDISYVMACGPSHNNLSDAAITFSTMVASEEAHAVHPTVIFNGTTLIDGVDYVVVGSVDYTVAGEYTCYVRGIYNYSGLVQCNYVVVDSQVGDVNDDGVVDTLDRMVLSRYLANWDEYDVDSINMAAADVNGDGVVDTLDRMVLNRYLANWDGYEDLPYVG